MKKIVLISLVVGFLKSSFLFAPLEDWVSQKCTRIFCAGCLKSWDVGNKTFFIGSNHEGFFSSDENFTLSKKLRRVLAYHQNECLFASNTSEDKIFMITPSIDPIENDQINEQSYKEKPEENTIPEGICFNCYKKVKTGFVCKSCAIYFEDSKSGHTKRSRPSLPKTPSKRLRKIPLTMNTHKPHKKKP